MTLERRILVGRDIHSSDNMKVGEIKGVTGDAEFVVVDRPLGETLLIPMDEVREVGGRLEVNRTTSYLDDAPEVDPDGMTVEDRQRLEAFYRARAA